MSRAETSRSVASRSVAQRIGVAVGQRLLLGLAPSLLAVVLVVALAYYGEVGREAPEYVVGGAGALALVSLIVTWSNARYLTQRLRHLGRRADQESDAKLTDELDRIDRDVARLQAELAEARETAETARSEYHARLVLHATMLASATQSANAQLDEVRLPLHILLDAKFGDLNENQEELLSAARTAADAVDESFRQLALLAEIDRDAVSLRRSSIGMNDVMRAVSPLIRAAAERVGVAVDLELEPALPSCWANRSSVSEAVTLLATTAIEMMAPGDRFQIRTKSSSSRCRVQLRPWRVTEPRAATLMAQRVLEAQEVQVLTTSDTLVLDFPRAVSLPTLPPR